MCTGGDSNQGPLGPKSDALTTAPPQATSRLHDSCSITLSCDFSFSFADSRRAIISWSVSSTCSNLVKGLQISKALTCMKIYKYKEKSQFCHGD